MRVGEGLKEILGLAFIFFTTVMVVGDERMYLCAIDSRVYDTSPVGSETKLEPSPRLNRVSG